jgi:hypothetical protein
MAARCVILDFLYQIGAKLELDLSQVQHIASIRRTLFALFQNFQYKAGPRQIKTSEPSKLETSRGAYPPPGPLRLAGLARA